MTEERKLVFISHATPEDSEFTRWLASRLTSLGYLVWSDVTQLFGAEKFWRDIEDAIRNHAAKVVVVLSRVSQTKDGVLNEIHTALNVEKKHGFDRFVVPIRVDDLPSTDVISVLVQKNYIDFHRNRADGFKKLLTLLEKSNVPRAQTQSARDASRWIDQVLVGPQKVVQEPQTVLSNWLPFDALPVHLNFYRVPIPNDRIRASFESFSYPAYPYRDMIATFASLDDVNTFLPAWQVPTRAYEIPLNAILRGEPHKLEELEWPEASRMLNYLFRMAWDNAMRSKGLHPYVMANGRHAWYFADGYRDKNSTPYADLDGVARRRKLIGYSKKRKVYWHYAAAVQPFIGRAPHLVLNAHVPFSEDGKYPLSSVKRMHSLRRSFCRSWWNDRWRDLLLAYMAQISDEDGHIRLSVGQEQSIQVCPRPRVFESPVSVQGIGTVTVVEDETDEELDRLADEAALSIDGELEEDFEEAKAEHDEGVGQ